MAFGFLSTNPKEGCAGEMVVCGFLGRANHGCDFLPAVHLLNCLCAQEGQEMNERAAPLAALCLEGIFCLSKLLMTEELVLKSSQATI